jgi:hypothetical protein
VNVDRHMKHCHCLALHPVILVQFQRTCQCYLWTIGKSWGKITFLSPGKAPYSYCFQYVRVWLLTCYIPTSTPQ